MTLRPITTDGNVVDKGWAEVTAPPMTVRKKVNVNVENLSDQLQKSISSRYHHKSSVLFV